MKTWLSRIFGGQNKPAPPIAATVARAGESIGKKPGEPNAPHPGLPPGPMDSHLANTGGDWPPGQELLDDFLVERTLGEGGMGIVYLLRSRSTGSEFAVKRAKGLKEADRRNFLAELQTWIDLPEHANLVPCRFFRTVSDEVLIFAEYVEGGSLKEWIASKKLYEGSPQEALERVLDVAIQFAWGLHCLHELGLVHQDVKPGNVLLGAEGKSAVQGVRPRVTDYGLARARAAAGETLSTDPGRRILVSSGGGTPAYWSPEQSQGLPLTRKTDLWSWAVSLLEMFTGEVTWHSGAAAEAALHEYLAEHPSPPAHSALRTPHSALPSMPGGVADLLRECFRQNPAGRPASLANAVDRLKETYRKSLGTDYSRALNVITRAASPQTGIKERRHGSGTAWTDPQEWLQKALRAAGRDPAEAAAMVARRGMTRQGELVAEMAAYDEAKRLYARLVRSGRKDLESDLATLCLEKAWVHRTAADEQGALQEYDQAIAIWERLVNQEGRRELVGDLARLKSFRGDDLIALGEKEKGLADMRSAQGVLEAEIARTGRADLKQVLTWLQQQLAKHST